MNVLSVENLSKSYGNQKAVDNLSFFVEKGEVFGLLGANGAGKTTTVECVLGTKKHESGTISIFENNPLDERKRLFERVSVQFQESHFQDRIKVAELCEVTDSLYHKPNDFRTLLHQFGLAEKSKSFVSELSGGEKQRLFIILALIPNPELIFLDKLTTGLDARARRDVWKYLLDQKAKGITIFLTSHFMDEVEALCDRICINKKGKMVFQGTVKQAIENSPHEKLEDAYLWYTDEEESQ